MIRYNIKLSNHIEVDLNFEYIGNLFSWIFKIICFDHLRLKITIPCNQTLLTRFRITCNKWISLETFKTGAHWSVIDRLAFGILSASINARIRTPALDAGLVGLAIWMQYAFWSACWRWSNGSWLTRARTSCSMDWRLTVRTAHIARTRIFSSSLN